MSSDITPLLSDSQNEVQDLRPKPPAGVAWQSTAWLWLVWSWRFVIFAVTGSTSVAVTRMLMKYVLGMEGPWSTSPWIPYRLTLILLTLPVYTVLIVLIGTLAGQHRFFAHVAWRMWGWAIPARWARRFKGGAGKGHDLVVTVEQVSVE